MKSNVEKHINDSDRSLREEETFCSCHLIDIETLAKHDFHPKT